MVFNATFNNISVILIYRDISFVGGGKQSTRRKPDISQVTDILTYHVSGERHQLHR